MELFFLYGIRYTINIHGWKIGTTFVYPKIAATLSQVNEKNGRVLVSFKQPPHKPHRNK